MARLNDACRSLMKAKESTELRLKRLDEERRELKSSLKSLDLALKALGHKPATPSKPIPGVEENAPSEDSQGGASNVE